MLRNKVVSSNIQSIGYDEKTKVLEVEFYNQKVFQYTPIAPEGYQLLLSAESIGSFFNQHIKNNPQVTCTQVL